MRKTVDHTASPNGGNNASASEHATSKFTGQPGALTALRVDYTAKDRAFPAHAATSQLGKVREEVKQLSSGPRLGDRPLWSTSSSTAPLAVGGSSSGPVGSVHYAAPSSCIGTATVGLPQRAMMSQNSAFQAVKLNYNFRSEALPPVKEVLYIPKHNKLEIDKTVFLLQGADKTTTVITDKCLTTHSALSRAENQNTFDGKRSGEVRPLVDTFGEHNVRRHISVRTARQPNGNGDTSNYYSNRHMDGSQSDGDGSNPSAAGGGPRTLRDAEDTDVMRSHTRVQPDGTKEQREAGWNTSSALPKERTCIYNLREYTDYRPINKKKEGVRLLRGVGGSGGSQRGAGSGPHDAENNSNNNGGWAEGGVPPDPDVPIGIDVAAEAAAAQLAADKDKQRRHGVYTTPIERQKKISSEVRAKKIEARREAAKAAEREAVDNLTLRGGSGSSLHTSGGNNNNNKSLLASGGVVYKMSNKEEWWAALPSNVEECRAKLAASHVSRSDTFNANNSAAAVQAPAAARGAGPAVVADSASDSD